MSVVYEMQLKDFMYLEEANCAGGHLRTQV